MTDDARHVTGRCWVDVKGFDPEADDAERFYLVDPIKSNAMENRIANNCPLAETLIGSRPGNTIEFQAPSGPVELTVVDCGELPV